MQGAVIRDTGAHIGRLLWSVLAAGEMDPISDGRTDPLAQAQPSAEAGLRAYAGNQFEAFNGQTDSNVKPRQDAAGWIGRRTYYSLIWPLLIS